MEELGFWELVHGMSAGCAATVAFESVKEFMHGAPLLVAVGLLTVLLFKVHHWHYKRMKRMGLR